MAPASMRGTMFVLCLMASPVGQHQLGAPEACRRVGAFSQRPGGKQRARAGLGMCHQWPVSLCGETWPNGWRKREAN
mgnify:CR=1 FL=1